MFPIIGEILLLIKIIIKESLLKLLSGTSQLSQVWQVLEFVTFFVPILDFDMAVNRQL